MTSPFCPSTPNCLARSSVPSTCNDMVVCQHDSYRINDDSRSDSRLGHLSRLRHFKKTIVKKSSNGVPLKGFTRDQDRCCVESCHAGSTRFSTATIAGSTCLATLRKAFERALATSSVSGETGGVVGVGFCVTSAICGAPYSTPELVSGVSNDRSRKHQCEDILLIVFFLCR